jgi:creatinine amidohydrolase
MTQQPLATPSTRLVSERVALLPAILAQTLELPPPALDPALRQQRVVVTGGGLSEGPARYFTWLLADALGLRATFVALSAFAGPPELLDGELLVLFSQGVAPNARLPLQPAVRRRFAQVVVFTSVEPDRSAPPDAPARLLADAVRDGASVQLLPPRSESGLLIRVLGGAAAALQAARLASEWALAEGRPPLEVGAVPAAVAQVLRTPLPRLVDPQVGLLPAALLVSGRYTDAAFAQRWKLLEGLRLPDPPIWDVLGFAHGPFQQLYARPHLLLALDRGLPHEQALLRRLESLLRPHHRLVRLGASLPGPLAWFEHDAQVSALVAQALRELDETGRPLDLAAWPGQGEDGALYDVAEPLVAG